MTKISLVPLLLTTLMMAKEETCYSLQLYSFPLSSETDDDRVDIDIYPDTCRQMSIGSQNTVRCECVKNYKQALKLKSKYDYYASDTAVVETYAWRFASRKNLTRSLPMRHSLEQPSTIQDSKLSEENLKLVLKVMLFSGDVEKALMVAKQGAKKFPNTLWWNEKVAEIALWNSQPSDALEYYLHVYALRPNSKSREKVETLATKLQNQTVLLQLLKDSVWNHTEHNKTKLYEAYLNSGELKEGIDFFERVYRRDDDAESLKFSISLCLYDGEIDKAEESYQILKKRYGDDLNLSMTLAKGFFSRKYLSKSYAYLKPFHTVLSHEHDDFWYFYIDVLWLNRSFDTLYTVLSQRHKLNRLRPYDQDRLAMLASTKDKAFASELALEKFKKELSLDHFMAFIALSNELKHYDRIDKELDRLESHQRQYLETTAEYWLIRGQIALRQSNAKAAEKYFNHALSIKPNDIGINTAYGWFLLDHSRSEALKGWLNRIEKSPASKQGAYDLLCASAYLQLQHSSKAAEYIKKRLSKDPENPHLYVLYSDILMLKGEREYAQKNLREGWKRFSLQLRNNPNLEKNSEFLNTYLRLAEEFEPQKKKRLESLAKRYLSENNDRLFRFGKLTRRSNDEAIVYAKHTMKLSEPWIEFYVSMLRNDFSTMSAVLDKHLEVLPKSDVIRVLQQQGEHRYAETLTFAALEDNPDNPEFYKHLYELSHEGESTITELSYVRRSPLSFQETRVQLNIPLKNEQFISTVMRHRIQQSKDYSKLSTVPPKDDTVTMEWKRQYDRFDIDLTIGYRDYLSSLWRGNVGTNYQLSGNTLFSFYTFIGDDAEESIYLSLGGYKNAIAWSANHRLTPSFQFSGVYKQNRFYDAEGSHVGAGKEVTMALTKQLREAYPDMGFRSSVGYYDYESSFNNGKINTLTPSYLIPLLPESYYQWGFGTYYGMKTREKFQRKWRPYANIDFAYTQKNGMGYSVLGGIGGMILGEDRLSVELHYASGFSTIDDYYKVSLWYYIYGW